LCEGYRFSKEVFYMSKDQQDTKEKSSNDEASQEATEKEKLDLTFCQRVRRFLFQRPYVIKLTFIIYRVYKFFEE
jgi:hypothetical protein